MPLTPGVLAAGNRRQPEGTGAEDAIAGHGEGPLLVFGHPGSGRTSALAARFAALVDAGVRPEQILCLVGSGSTEPLRRRVDAIVGALPHDELQVLTVAAAAARLLRDEAIGAGLDPFAVTATRTDRLALLLGRIDELPLRHHDLGGRPALLIGALLERIDALKAAGITAGDLEAWAARLPDGEPRTLREREFAQIITAHDRMLEQGGLLDAGEAVLAAQRALERGDLIRARVAARWRHLLVDDLEDVTPAQLRLIELLCAPSGDLVATVDSDGRISADGLSAERIAGLVAHGIGGHRTSTVDLGPSRRCPPQVATIAAVEAAGVATEPCVRALRAESVRAEAQAVAEIVAGLIASGAEPETIAVLVPSVRRDGQAPALALSERAVPHRLAGAAALLGQAEVRDVVAWLRLLSDPSDATAAVRALTRPPIALHGVDVARCLQIARRRRLDMVRGLAAATESPQLPPEARDRVLAFLRHYERAAQDLDTIRPDRFVHELIDDLGLRRRQVFTAQAAVIERLRGLARLCELAAGYGDRAPQATPREFARWLASLADAGVPEGEAGGAEIEHGVTILELAAAKGRSWDHVLICGLSSAQLPGRGGARAAPLPAELLGEPDGVEPPAHEQQAARALALLRLGATRAAKTLTLSFAAEGPGGTARTAAPVVDAACERACVRWEPVAERLGSSGDERLQSAFAALRDELLADVQRIGARLGELRLDTDLDVAHGATRYLELLKVAALLARPEGQPVNDALPAVTSAIESAATALQREILRTSSLDESLAAAGAPAPLRPLDAAATARHEPPLDPFLPRRGDGLALSASDLDTYRTCPLKYKFARVLRVPQDPTINQRFGIVVHQVLERFHAADPDTPARPRALEGLIGLLDTSWRRAGFGWATDEEVQLWRKAEEALRRYHQRFHTEDVEPVWFERSFTFMLGAHTLRGRVDRVDRLPEGGYELIDYKTGRPRTPDELREDVQLALYAVAARRAWNLPASSGAYLYVLDDLKVPLPEGTADEAWIGEIVGEVAAGIRAQNFEPTPSFSACSMCDYQLACPAAEH